MKWVFGSIAGRFFFVFGLALLVGANIYAARTLSEMHPTHWYFWTEDGKGVHIHQPGGRRIVGQTIRPIFSDLQADGEAYEKRCSIDRANKKSSIVGAEHRGILLCNSGDYADEEFGRRHAYFKTAVDEEYARYYWRTGTHFVEAMACALGIWLALLSASGVVRWVMVPGARA